MKAFVTQIKSNGSWEDQKFVTTNKQYFFHSAGSIEPTIITAYKGELNNLEVGDAVEITIEKVKPVVYMEEDDK